MYETDVVQRTNRAIKACRIITDIIPFDKRNQALLEEPDIMKYLMLCMPLNPGSVSNSSFLTVLRLELSSQP